MTIFKFKQIIYSLRVSSPLPQYETFRLPGCYNVTVIHFL